MSQESADHLLQLLRSLTPFSTLDDAALYEAVESSHLIKLDRNSEFHASEVHDAHCFLVSGELDLYEHERFLQKIVANTPRASEPLFRLSTEALRAVCRGRCQIVCIQRTLVDRVVGGLGHAESSVPPSALTQIELTEHENLLLSQIHQRFDSDKVKLPSLPDVAVQINKVINDPDINLRRIAGVLQTDPVIAVRLMQMANSAFYGGLQPVGTLPEAVSRVGLQRTQAVVMSVVLNNLYSPRSPLCKQYMHALYEHSIFIGALSQAICRRLKRFNADRALLAGLLHDIGIVPILILVDNDDAMRSNPVLLNEAISKLHGFVGGLLLQHWGFDQDLIVVAEEADDWMRDNKEEPDYCDVVLVAQLHTGLLRGAHSGHPQIHSVPAYTRLGLDRFKPETGVHILNEARQSVNSTVQLLRA